MLCYLERVVLGRVKKNKKALGSVCTVRIESNKEVDKTMGCACFFLLHCQNTDHANPPLFLSLFSSTNNTPGV